MAVFRYYNVQLLPLDTKSTQLLTADEYKDLFIRAKNNTIAAIAAKHLELVSATLRNDFRFSFFKASELDELIYGTFIKFNHIDELRDLYTDNKTQDVGIGVTHRRGEFEFVWNPRTHILAISKLSIKTKSNRPQMRLMSGSGVINALETLLSPISEERFKNYVLSIHEMTSSESLDDVLNADGYKSIEAKVAFSNSDELIDAIADELESDLKQNNVHDAEIIQRSAKRSEMSGLTKTALAFLALATKHGNAVVRYRKNHENRKYQMADYPVEIRVQRLAKGEENDYWRSIGDSIFEAIKKTRLGDMAKKALKSTIGSDDEHQKK